MTDEPAHSRLSPSSSSGWANCPDFPNANAGLEDDRKEAAEGTVAHEIVDVCVKFGFDAHDFVGKSFVQDGFTIKWDEDDADLLQQRIDRLREWAELPDAQFFSEQTIDCSAWLGPGEKGTFDAGFILPSEGLVVLDDFKWGRYVPVYPVRNFQVMIYLLNWWEQTVRHITDITEFLIIIDQPRNSGGGGRWRTNLAELLEFGVWIKERAEATRQPNPPRIATPEGCRWCRRRKQEPNETGALTGCLAFDRFMLSDLSKYGDEILSAEQRAYLHQNAKLIAQWLKSIEIVLLDAAKTQRPAGGLKAVTDSHGTRDKYSDEEAVDALLEPILGERRFNKKLITPIQAGKKLKPEEKAQLQALVIPGVRNTVLVSEEDARPAVIERTADDFDDE